MLQRGLSQVNQLGSLLVQSILQRPAGAAMHQTFKATFSIGMPNASTFGMNAWAFVRAPLAPSLMHIKQATSPGCSTSIPLLMQADCTESQK